jgi:purine-binding chemotaxis protein CheW
VTSPIDSSTVRALREEFDRSFSVAPGLAVDRREDLLAVEVARDPYVLRGREVSGLVSGRRIVSVPSARPALLGLLGNRGSLVTVYSLGVLLGYEARPEPPKWLVLAGDGGAVGFAFDAFEGFLRVSTGDLCAAPSQAERRHLPEVLHVGERSRPVIDLRSILEALDVRSTPAVSPKEA